MASSLVLDDKTDKGKQDLDCLEGTNTKCFPCLLCAYKTEQEKDLALHMSAMHKDLDSSSITDESEKETLMMCNRLIVSVNPELEDEAAKNSKPSHHKGDGVKNVTLPEDSSFEGEKAFSCPLCAYKSDKKRNLAIHIDAMHNKDESDDSSCSSSDCDNEEMECDSGVVKTEEIKDAEEQIGAQTFACSFCAYTSDQEINVAKHTAAMHKGENGTCILSDYRVELMEHLKQRVESVNDQLTKNELKMVSEFSHWMDDGKKSDGFDEGSSGKMELSCAQCEYKTNNKKELKKHLNSSHKSLKKFCCMLCDYRSRRRWDVTKHIAVVHEGQKNFVCPHCDHKMGTKQHLEMHVRTVHMGRKDFACEQCDYRSAYKHLLQAHKATAHDGRKEFACSLCEYKSGYKYRLKSHFEIVHEGRKDFACDRCSFKTGLKWDLKKHVETVHEGKKGYECPICGYKAGRKYDVSRHIEKVHMGKVEKNLACPSCDYKCRNSWELNKHAKVVHEGIKEFACAKCPYKSAYRFHLASHIRAVHGGIKKFACPECDFKSSYKSCVKTHVESVHKPKEDFACSLCDFISAHKRSLNRHIATTH